MRIIKLTDKTGKPFWIKAEACMALLPADPSRNDKREWAKTQIMVAPGLTIGVRERMMAVCAMLEGVTIPLLTEEEAEDDTSDKQERAEDVAGVPETGVAEVQETERVRGVFRIAEAKP